MYYRKHIIFPLLTIAALTIFSCSNDDDNVTEYSRSCYISSFTLGTLQRIIYGKTSQGMDSIYTTTFSGSYFPMVIDQRGDSIVNTDSLPIRSKVERVVTTVAFTGTLYWRKADLTGLADTTWHAYSNTDSLDFTTPLHFRVFSAGYLSNRTYTVKVNVHQQKGDSTTWDAIGQVSELTATTSHKAFVWNNTLNILSKKSGGTLQLTQHPLTTSGSWTATPTTGASNAIPATLQQQGGRLLLSTTDGNLLESTDGTTWSAATYPSLSGMRLVAASDDYIYALSGGRLYRSNGTAWDEEQLDDDVTLLPSSNLCSVFYTMENGTKRLILMGSQTDNDTYATVWAKAWKQGNEGQESWIYYTPNNADKYRCPLVRNLNILTYDGGLQAIGGRSADGNIQPLDYIRHSADHGITWKPYTNDDMNVDAALHTAAQTATYISAAADANNFIWVVVDDKVWRGRINRLGWK